MRPAGCSSGQQAMDMVPLGLELPQQAPPPQVLPPWSAGRLARPSLTKTSKNSPCFLCLSPVATPGTMAMHTCPRNPVWQEHPRDQLVHPCDQLMPLLLLMPLWATALAAAAAGQGHQPPTAATPASVVAACCSSTPVEMAPPALQEAPCWATALAAAAAAGATWQLAWLKQHHERMLQPMLQRCGG